MNIDLLIRIMGLIFFAIAGVIWGVEIRKLLPEQFPLNVEIIASALGVIGAVSGFFLTPFFTLRPIRSLRSQLSKVSSSVLLASLAGMVTGLVIAALLSFPLSLLPAPFGSVMPFVGVVVFSYLGVSVTVARKNEMLHLLRSIGRGARLKVRSSKDGNNKDKDKEKEAAPESKMILLDTSVIIDGRIADIARTGFLPGTMLIPRFVLNELQYIADSADGLRRQRGRRGMEILSQMQKEPTIPLRISDIDVDGTREVDEKLVILARQMKCKILTNDYNLNRIAELQGVTILNVNDLANAVKSVLLPGETLNIRVIQEGKEYGQGVGYMDDGTMVVVENGKDFMNHEIQVTVTKILQTAAGRMIFGKPE